MLEMHELTLLNGRSYSDFPANFTHIYTTKTDTGSVAASGSVIDLIWCSSLDFDLCKDFYVLNLVTKSDHLPVTLELSFSHPSSIDKPFSTLVWDETKKNNFNYIMELKREVGNLQGSVSALNSNLISTITAAATQSGMLKTFSVNKRNQTKPWFDNDCKKIKLKVKNQLIICKATNYTNCNLLNYTKLKQQFKNLTKAKKRSM